MICTKVVNIRLRTRTDCLIASRLSDGVLKSRPSEGKTLNRLSISGTSHLASCWQPNPRHFAKICSGPQIQPTPEAE